MDPYNQTVPAWRRLGLSLKRDDQSGDTAPDLQGTHAQEQPCEAQGGLRERNEDINTTVGSTENGKSSGLGKRKHDHGQAKEQGKPLKKSRAQKDQSSSNGTAGFVPQATAKEENAIPSFRPEAVLASDKPQSKGDVNYRKKKGQRITSYKSEQNGSENSHHDVQLANANEKEQDSRQHPAQSGRKQSRADSSSPSDAGVVIDKDTLVVSTETDFPPSPPAAILRGSKKRGKYLGNATLDPSPPQAGRRKSVTFTPDTKTTDGNSASNLFKKWVAEQKGADAEFAPAEVAQFAAPPKLHPANDLPASQSSHIKGKLVSEKVNKETRKKQKREHQAKPAASLEEGDPTPPLKSVTKTDKRNAEPAGEAKGKKKDPSIYLSYLSQYHSNRANWKFNKAKQNDVLDNALNIFRIPDSYSDALLEYIKGLKGAGMIERLQSKCETTIKELNEADAQDPSAMNDADARADAKEEALEERLRKEKKRRTTDADIEMLQGHPCPDGFIRRLKRRRAEALLSALNMAIPMPRPPAVQADGTSHKTASALTKEPNPRNRKRRTDIVSDDSSSSESSSMTSSSEESSSEESEGQGSTSNSSTRSSDDESDDEENAGPSESRDSDDSGDSEVGSSSDVRSGSGVSEDEESETSSGSESD